MRRPLLALIVLLVALGIGYAVHATESKSPTDSPSTRPPISATTLAPTAGLTALSTLPAQAWDTVRLIQAHGPFPYSQDGVVFNNAERHLPSEKNGYYHEYTVKTPGSSDRGARRIITGADGEYYYTADHYDSFVQVDVSR